MVEVKKEQKQYKKEDEAVKGVCEVDEMRIE